MRSKSELQPVSTVIITGPPGAGKSSTARALAEMIGGEVLDTDQLIEEATGKKISEIFTDDGEQYFRAQEEVAVDRALTHHSSRSKIISLGGGAVLSEITRERLRKSDGKIFFLEVSIAYAAPRIGFNRDRPLLVDNPRAKWVALKKERQAIYESVADVIVNTDGKSAREVAQEIVGTL
ncbi:MAG: shikimate kinase [Actinobacteria bacterium]|nr:shikimate kinase [Actinomycetota bacterium]